MPTARKRQAKSSKSEPPPVIRVPGWDQDWLIHGFSTRLGGRSTVYRNHDLNLGFTAADDRDVVAQNRQLFTTAVADGKAFQGLVTVSQIHSSVLCRVGAQDALGDGQPLLLKGDGLMTNDIGVLLGIQTADCIPVLVADRKKRAVAAFHAGWRGTVARIVEKGIGRMRLEFGSNPEDLIAAIGPGIGRCCYSIGQEVREQFDSQFQYASELFHEVHDSDPVRENDPMLFRAARAPGHSKLGPRMHLDLAEANRRQLIDAGLKGSAVFLTGECTGCHTDRFFSHRLENGLTGRLMSVIGMAASRD